MMVEGGDKRDESVSECVSVLCLSIENSWSGQHAYEWHCGSHSEEYRQQPEAWPSPHDNQWVSSRTSTSW